MHKLIHLLKLDTNLRDEIYLLACVVCHFAKYQFSDTRSLFGHLDISAEGAARGDLPEGDDDVDEHDEVGRAHDRRLPSPVLADHVLHRAVRVERHPHVRLKDNLSFPLHFTHLQIALGGFSSKHNLPASLSWSTAS